MLTQLHIRDMLIIERLDLGFKPGLNVLTGETGAGKSILLDAIGLVLGDRADSATVRPGANRAEINASFQPRSVSPVWSWLREHDLDDDGQCQLRRVVAAEGKSRGYINGRPVTLQTLRSVGEMLVDIHGQHEHYALSQSSSHRALLDSTSKNQALLHEVHERYQRWHDTQDNISVLSENAEQRTQRVDMLRFQIEEFEALNLTTDELDSIETEHKRTSNAGHLLELANQTLLSMCDAEMSADAQLNTALKHVQQLHSLDDAIADCMELINTAAILAQEAGSSLRDYVSHVDVDDDRLQYLDERLANLHRLAKKHHTDIRGLLDVQNQLAIELAALNGDSNNIDHLQAESDALLAVYHTQADKLTRVRQKSAKTLSKSVTAAIHSLGMHGGEFQCQVTPSEQGPSRHGQDSIRFLVSTNPGMQAGDISKIASGGELSRISLALAMVSTGHDTILSLIFDEVDSGIGGGVAVTVGHYLRELGARAQVLCVTHLPQVAAQAHHHLRVSKKVHKGKTTTVVTPLSGKQTVEEIARMLGGSKVTQKSRQHAREMLESNNA